LGTDRADKHIYRRVRVLVIQVKKLQAIADQAKGEVRLALRGVEVVFAGCHNLTDLTWLLASGGRATGTDGGRVIIRHLSGSWVIRLRRGETVERCWLTDKQFSAFANGLAPYLLDARECAGAGVTARSAGS
jgi:hypothetical protein